MAFVDARHKSGASATLSPIMKNVAFTQSAASASEPWRCFRGPDRHRTSDDFAILQAKRLGILLGADARKVRWPHRNRAAGAENIRIVGTAGPAMPGSRKQAATGDDGNTHKFETLQTSTCRSAPALASKEQQSTSLPENGNEMLVLTYRSAGCSRALDQNGKQKR
jgi:hypothetical protein